MNQRRSGEETALRSIDVEPLLDLALHMANRADEIALAGFGTGPRAETKPDGTPVTRVDREVESALRDTIEREHPRAGILGEEYGEEPGVGRWVIDPIDGTREFIAGDPRFSVLIAYEVDDEPLVGVVSSPALGLRWWGGSDLGAFLSYRGEVARARVSRVKDTSRARGMLLGGFSSRDWPVPEAVVPFDGFLDGMGARLSRRGVSWEAVRVAGGEFDFALTSGYIWDVAPLPVIVREAGGWAGMVGEDGNRYLMAMANSSLGEVLSELAG